MGRTPYYQIRIKAFTLLELLIASLITAIIAFAVIFFLNSFLQTQKLKNKAQQQIEDLALFDLLMVDDLFMSDTFYLDQKILFIEKNHQLISYDFGDQQLIRTHQKDRTTFTFTANDLSFHPENSIQKTPLRIVINLALDESFEIIYIDEADYRK
ncbi:MAG: hypothetical protein N4A45_10835 [Flavobacteriales bacterium]|jgi:competence protein ComGF|nr:hypothetical protein [Flavobacteriales bacterium]